MRGFARHPRRDVVNLALERGHRRRGPFVLDVDGIFPFDDDGDGGKRPGRIWTLSGHGARI